MGKYGKQCHSLCVIHYGNLPEKVRVLRFQSLIMGLLWVLSICALRLLQGGRKPIKSSLLLPALYQNADQHKQADRKDNAKEKDGYAP